MPALVRPPVSFHLALRVHQVAEAVRSAVGRFMGKNGSSVAPIVPVIETTHTLDTTAQQGSSIGVNLCRAWAYYAQLFEAVQLFDDYVATVSGGLSKAEVLDLCMFDPDTARVR